MDCAQDVIILQGGTAILGGSCGTDAKDVLHRDVWVPDERPRLGEGRADALALRPTAIE